MIDAAGIVERLQLLKGNALKFIGQASDFASAADQMKASPSAFVLPSARRPGANTAGTEVVSQRVAIQFTIVTMFARVGPSGGDQLNAIQSVEDAIVDRMVGWEPEGLWSPFIYGGGRMLGIDMDKGTIFWGSDFVASYLLRKVSANV
jgi:hypothetical protein